MHTFFKKAVIFLLCGIIGGSSCLQKKKQAVIPTDYRRVISLAPSITETLFALGLGGRVVGVTQFCTFPEAAQHIPNVGGYTNPNYEAILLLKPDIVVCMKEQFTVIEFLTKNNIACCVIDNHNVVSILKSFTLLGNTFDRKREADSLVRQITTELADTTTSVHGKPRILLCIDRENKGSGTISKMYAAGGRTFYTELIAAAGGVNALSDTSIIYPQLSIEGAVRLQPDIVIDFSYPSQTLSCERLISDWNSLDMLAAVRNKMVFCRAADYLTIPGPRLHLIVKDLKEIVGEYKKRLKDEG